MSITAPASRFVHPLLRAHDWQARPEFDQLCDWWRKGGIGVCALIGIGGAGKTAIADRFLRVLPAGLPAPQNIAKDATLPFPRSLFVFSFYDAPNPDGFFAQLYSWLSGDPFDECAKTPSYQQTLQILGKVAQPPRSRKTASPILLLLDGLEKVQDDGARSGAFGQLLDGRLRDLILRVGEGWLPGVALGITTRFRLFDAEAKRCDRYLPIDIEELQPPAALALLRTRGVKATDANLLALAEENGFHALTLDLLGGYVAAFCDGDPSRLPPLAKVKVPDEAAADDPRLAAVKEQERTFGRLAQRYREALAASDPAALALVERVCLFRLGVSADMLTAIFTGPGKEVVSGSALAALSREQVGRKLRWLARMHLLDRCMNPSTLNSKPSEASPNYTVHPAIRDSFLQGIDTNTIRLSHEAAKEGLIGELGGFSGSGSHPSDPATLDMLEEIIFHVLAAGHSKQAWEIFTMHLGGYKNLAWRLGQFARGERICRLFLAVKTHEEPQCVLPSRMHSDFFLEWGVYLDHLGQLKLAEMSFHRHLSDPRNLNLVTVLFQRGYIAEARVQSEAGLRAVKEEVFHDEPIQCEETYRFEKKLMFYSNVAHAYAMQGQTAAALENFDHASRFGEVSALYGLWQAQLLARLGKIGQAWLIAKTQGGLCIERFGEAEFEGFDLLIAELAIHDADLASARTHCERNHTWALERDSLDLLCWSFLVRARIRLAEFRCQTPSSPSHGSEFTAQGLLAEAGKSLGEGLRIARDCGYGIYHIDLLLERARLHLLRGDAQRALNDLGVALDDGVRPPPDSGFPMLLAANDSECGYAWGKAEGGHLRAEAFLLQAAQVLNRTDFAPSNFEALPAEVRSLIKVARRELEKCHELRERIQDPKLGDTGQVLKDLEGGVLTRFPLVGSCSAGTQTCSETVTDVAERVPTKPRTRMAKKHIFLSYCHDNETEVAQLRADLIAAGEAVWWDRDILPGEDWKQEIRRAIKDSFAVVLCLSSELAARIESGVYPEVADAIGFCRQQAPGSIFLIPIRLSDCSIPDIEIDDVRTLDRLQFTDLFPAAKRATGLQKLLYTCA